MSAQRAYEIGLVSEVVPGAELRERVEWAARTIADAPELGIQGTVRALWTGLELSRRQAIEVANFLCRIGSDPREFIKAQARFKGGGRTEWRLR